MVIAMYRAALCMIAVSITSGVMLAQLGMQAGLVYAQGSSSTTDVEIVEGALDPNNGRFYVPAEIQISTVGTVKWTNNDITIHTVTAGTPGQGPSQQFDSGLINPKEIYENTFNEPGSFDYYCTLHPWMIGKVTVG